MVPTVVRFRGSLTPRVLARASGMTVGQADGHVVLTGHISPAALRALVDALVEEDHELVDVSGARVDDVAGHDPG